jgi:hypothetical protein
MLFGESTLLLISREHKLLKGGTYDFESKNRSGIETLLHYVVSCKAEHCVTQNAQNAERMQQEFNC